MPECSEKKSQNLGDALLSCLSFLLVLFGSFVGLSFLYGILSGILGGIIGELLAEIITALLYIFAIMMLAWESLDQWIALLARFSQ